MYLHITLQKYFSAEIRPINWENEAIHMGIRDVGYQLYRTAHLNRFAIRNNR